MIGSSCCGRPVLRTALAATCVAVLLPGVVSIRARANAPGPMVEVGALPVRVAPAVDRTAVELEDREREALGLPPRFAIPHRVSIRPDHDGLWEQVDADTVVWRVRVASPGAVSLNLGFGRYRMPRGGRLVLRAVHSDVQMRPFTFQDNASHGELWTPVMPTDELVVEVTLPAISRDRLELELSSINVGYRGFGQPWGPASGPCNVDVVCPEGDPWRDEAASVGVYSTGGSLFCTGFMVNNTAQDRRPYFMTADHCDVADSDAASLVVYWNYQASTCGGPRDGSLDEFQTGAFLRAADADSDFTLLELDQSPDPDWNVTWAGWDRSGSDATSAVAIHHPNTDEKAISLEYQPTTTTSYLGSAVPGDGTHVRILDWDVGTTEPGSSGSPLFDSNHRVIGQLHGGYAACGNDGSDWYGKFAISWLGGGTPSTRLRDWLDPAGTGAMTLNTLGGTACDHDGLCETHESCLSCPSDCIAGSSQTICGDGICQIAQGEDCQSCPADCNSQTSGSPATRFCCGADVDCNDERCWVGVVECDSDPATLLYCCGDGVCEAPEDTLSCSVDCAANSACGDALCDPTLGESSCTCPGDCGAPPVTEAGASCDDGLDNDCDGSTDCADPDCARGLAPDGDGDGVDICIDCDDGDVAVWATPGAVSRLVLVSDGTIHWAAPVDPGATTVTFDVLRSTVADDFTSANCLATGIDEPATLDPELPSAGLAFHYLVRAVNGCPGSGEGSLGVGSSGGVRIASICP